MRIVEITPEAVPFVKTGGLADVAGALPPALQALGHDVSVFLPLYRRVRRGPTAFDPSALVVTVPVADRRREVRVRTARLPGSAVTWHALECDPLYDRDELYGDAHGDYPDNAERFVVFVRAVLEALEAMGHAPDILHAHDWQAALATVYAKTLYADRPFLRRARTVLTVHNLSYQGLFWHWDMPLTGLPWSRFNWRELEFYGKINFLKGGVVFADAVTTVSPRYAREIQTPEFGCGLDGALRHRADALHGILNGIDEAAWDPRTDPHLPARFGPDNLRGKAACKRRLQKRLDLPARADVPLFGFVGRLVDQKGVDLLEAVLPGLLERDVQCAILGAGQEKHHLFLQELRRRRPDQVGLCLGFDEALAHAIEAGADIFLMPSRFEPCGLSQMYSLRYGTAPVVRETGGLADTVVDCTPETLRDGTATGFSFRVHRPEAFREAIDRALAAFADASAWRDLIRRGMAQDWSWARSAERYVDVFERVIRSK